MKMSYKLMFFGIIFLSILNTSCESEKCNINYKAGLEPYKKAVNIIYELGLEMKSDEPYFRPIKTIKTGDEILEKIIFDQVEFVECHEDSTIIFQAFNCQPEILLRDVVYFLSYSPKGIAHLKGKRNTSNVREIEHNWFYGKHINTVADKTKMES